MYLRSLGSLLTRRFSPRRSPPTRAQPQAWAQESSTGVFSQAALGATAGRPARSFHTDDRDLAFVSGPFLSAVMAGLGLGGFLFFKKGTDESAGELAPKETSEVRVLDVWDPKDPAIKETFVDNVKDETAMKERFEQWMKQYNRKYRTEEEKAMRYERFKISARCSDRYADGKPNRFADWTVDEYARYKCPHGCDDFNRDKYNDEISARAAELGTYHHLGVTRLSPEKMKLLKEAEDRQSQAKICKGD